MNIRLYDGCRSLNPWGFIGPALFVPTGSLALAQLSDMGRSIKRFRKEGRPEQPAPAARFPVCRPLARAHRKAIEPQHRPTPPQGRVNGDAMGVSQEAIIFPNPALAMGIDKSLTDDFPSVEINGTSYHYGRETKYGQYLVENADYAKDYWCFDRREDMIAFLVNLPESADRDAVSRKFPDWSEVTHEQRGRYIEQHQAELRVTAELKMKDGTADFFNVLQFDDEGSGWYEATTDVYNHFDCCDDVEVVVREIENARSDNKELLIDLRVLPSSRGEEKTITVWRRQALKLAMNLLKAAAYVEARLPVAPADVKKF